MSLDPFTFILVSLAVYRVTRFCLYDSLIAPLRDRLFEGLSFGREYDDGTVELFGRPGLRGWFFSLLSCYWCFGVWVAGLFVLVWVVWGGLGCGAGVVVWLALSVVGAWLRMFELLVVGFIR
jgi:hypothetical protein